MHGKLHVLWLCEQLFCMLIRLAKEKVSYEQEADKQQQKIDDMKTAGEDEYVIKKQVSITEING